MKPKTGSQVRITTGEWQDFWGWVKQITDETATIDIPVMGKIYTVSLPISSIRLRTKQRA